MFNTTGAIVFPEAWKTSAALQGISGYSNYFNIVYKQVLWVHGNPVLSYEMTKLYIRPNLHSNSHSKWTVLNRHVMWRFGVPENKIILQAVDCLFWRLCSTAVSYVCCTFPHLGKWCLYSTSSHLCLGICVPVVFLLQLLCSSQCWSAFCIDGEHDFLLSGWVWVRTPGTRDLYIVIEIVLSSLQFTLPCQSCQHLGD